MHVALGMESRAGLRVLLVGVSVLAAGCAGPSGYAGTGSLSVSGSTSQPLLAFHSVRFDSCQAGIDVGPGEGSYFGVASRGPSPPTDPHDASMGFSIVTIGDACIMDGTGGPNDFHADPGTVCTLTFPDGSHPVRVTDFAARYGLTSSGRAYIDPNYIQVELGGDDAATGTHVLYRFAGNASADTQSTTSCDAERAKRASRGVIIAHDDHPRAP